MGNLRLLRQRGQEYSADVTWSRRERRIREQASGQERMHEMRNALLPEGRHGLLREPRNVPPREASLVLPRAKIGRTIGTTKRGLMRLNSTIGLSSKPGRLLNPEISPKAERGVRMEKDGASDLRLAYVSVFETVSFCFSAGSFKS